jgi:hypothetical protein
MNPKISVCFRSQYRDRSPQWRYWDGARWYGGYDRAHGFKSYDEANAFVASMSIDWDTQSEWLGVCDLPFVTTREEQIP